MKRLEISLLIALVFFAVLSLCSFEHECDGIRHEVLRMHVIANSDSPSDQELKLRVRDRIQAVSGDIFGGCEDFESAIKEARDNISVLEQSAREEIERSGLDYNVTVEVDDSWFPTRHYGRLTLPAGTYKAVRIKIGDAKGHNWWCVMFPMVCVPGSGGEQQLDVLLDENQLEIVKAQGYDVRLRCVELYEELLQKIKNGQSGC